MTNEEKKIYPKNKLKAARALCGMTQMQMAEAIGIGLTSYLNKEKGYFDVWLTEAVAILEVVKKHDETATLDGLFLRS